MTTQEKLEQKIFNLVYQWGRVGIVADHTAPTYVAYIQELIDSAKREGMKEGLDRLLKWNEEWSKAHKEPFNWVGAIESLKVDSE